MPSVSNLRELRRKIRSVENLKKITRAMQMVAASKLKKTQGRLLQIRAYADKISDLVAGLSGNVETMEHPLFDERPTVRAVVLVAISADKGLCGTYNAAVIEQANRFLREQRSAGRSVKLLTVGRKVSDFFARRDEDILARYDHLPTEVPFAVLAEITARLLIEFEAGRVDEIHVQFTRFVNALVFQPARVRFVPVERAPAAAAEERRDPRDKPMGDYIFEPGPKDILGRLLPRYLETSLHRMFLEANSSEHAARMNAMRNATDNASEMIDQLTLVRNKVRQANITKELLDIVGGAEALKG